MLRRRTGPEGYIDQRARLWSNTLEAASDDGLPLPELAFGLWLVGIHWVGMTRATVAAGA